MMFSKWTFTIHQVDISLSFECQFMSLNFFSTLVLKDWTDCCHVQLIPDSGLLLSRSFLTVSSRPLTLASRNGFFVVGDDATSIFACFSCDSRFSKSASKCSFLFCSACCLANLTGSSI